MREEVYELEDPVDVSGNKVSIVRLKRPDFDLICELGLPADCSSQQEQLKLLREYVIRLSGLPKETVGPFWCCRLDGAGLEGGKFFYTLGLSDKKTAVKLFYNTARFWGERPTELAREPFSRVIELAKEALRIIEEEKSWQEKNTASRRSYLRRTG